MGEPPTQPGDEPREPLEPMRWQPTQLGLDEEVGLNAGIPQANSLIDK